MKGSGIPVMGMMPMVMPAFWKTLKAKKVKIPAQSSRPKGSRASWAARRTREGDEAEQGQDQAWRRRSPAARPPR